jgi:hypothetical protein
MEIETKKEEINAAILKADLLKIKTRLEGIEDELNNQIQQLEEKEQKWKEMDSQVQGIIQNNNSIIRFNVSGRKFATKVQTLLDLKDTLFYKLILSKKFDLNKEIFFDRSPRMFSVIIDYLRYKKISYERFTREELDDLRVEAEYYEISPIISFLGKRKNSIEFVGFETNGNYMYNGSIVGNNSIISISERSLMTGICANHPGWIIIELNSEWEFDEIEIGGYAGNPTAWSCENGSGAQIQTSCDKIKWKNVGAIPSGFGSEIKTVKLTRSVGKYIRLFATSYLGVGFFNIKKL